MSQHAKEDSYMEMLKALQDFETRVLEACEKMNRSCKVCEGVLGGDSISVNSRNRLEEALIKYREVVTKSTDFRKKLSKDLIRIKEIERVSREG